MLDLLRAWSVAVAAVLFAILLLSNIAPGSTELQLNKKLHFKRYAVGTSWPA